MNEIVPNSPYRFVCEKCGIKTNNKKDYNKHCLTAKHINRTSVEPKPSQMVFSCKRCSKNYNARNSLWYHEQKCNDEQKCDGEKKKKIYINDENSQVSQLSNMVFELIKSNSDLQKQMMEVCKKTSNTVIANNNNKTFNLQFFLNEQCKDAMNLTDFVDSMTLEFSDLEDVGKLGYVEGISKIMIRKLNELDIYKRPIHCSDAKREIMYVKEHNVWEKEKNSNEHIRKAIKRVTHKNGGLLVPWSLENPNCMNLDHHLNDVYLRMMGQSMGGSGEFVDNENKIMKKIAKAVFIDK